MRKINEGKSQFRKLLCDPKIFAVSNVLWYNIYGVITLNEIIIFIFQGQKDQFFKKKYVISFHL